MSYMFDDSCFAPEVLDRVKEQRRARLVKLREDSARKNKVLFELEWLTPDEAKKAYRSLKRRSWQILIELAVSLFVLFCLMYLMGAILAGLIGIRA